MGCPRVTSDWYCSFEKDPLYVRECFFELVRLVGANGSVAADLQNPRAQSDETRL